MASASRVALLQLLLRQIDRHPPGVVDGVDLVGADPALLERLLADRILTEESPLSDIAPEATSQDELPRPVWRRGDHAVAFSVDGGSAPEPVDPRELVHYPINIPLLCRAIRHDNRLCGAGPEVLSPRTILVGWRAEAAGRRPVVLCRLLRDENAYEVVHMLASRLSTDRLILLTPTERSLGVDVSNSLRGRGVETVPAELALRSSAAHPFALRLEGWAPPAGSAPAADVALFVDTGGHRASFLGQELPLPSREFKVLTALARAFADGGHVSRDQLYDVLYPDAGHREAKVYDEQVTDAVSRLRKALAEVAKARGRPVVGRVIETKRKVGYRLAEEVGPVRVV